MKYTFPSKQSVQNKQSFAVIFIEKLLCSVRSKFTHSDPSCQECHLWHLAQAAVSVEFWRQCVSNSMLCSFSCPVTSGVILNRPSVFSSDCGWINEGLAVLCNLAGHFVTTFLTTGVKVKCFSNKNPAVFQLCYFKLSVHSCHSLSNCSNMPFFFKFLHEKFFSVGESHLSDSLN